MTLNANGFLVDPQVIILESPQNGDHGSGDLQHALTEHQTYGAEGGDLSVMLYGVGFHFYITKDGRIFQAWSVNNICYHCNGSNFRSMGLEFESLTGEPLTQAQIEAAGHLHRLLMFEGLTLMYVDPDGGTNDVAVDGTNFTGCIPHKRVKTDDGSSQHTDHITMDEWARITDFANSGVEPEREAQPAFQIPEDDMDIAQVMSGGNNNIFEVNEKGELWVSIITGVPANNVRYRVTVNGNKDHRSISVMASAYGPCIILRGPDDNGAMRYVRVMVKGYIWTAEYLEVPKTVSV